MEGREILKIRGIPLRVHQSWFLILTLFTWSAQKQLVNVSEIPLPTWSTWFLAFITSLLLFASVLLHELGHSFMALHEGVQVRSITLFFLGGVAKVEKECSNPMGTFRIALAGPLVSLSLAGLLLFGANYISTFNILFSK